jgi:hypothetical protein
LNAAETIFIPSSIRGERLSAFRCSVRLANVLDQMDARVLGDLHGRSYAEIAKRRNCGRKTVSELRELVKQAQHSVGQIAAPVPMSVLKPDRFSVPDELRGLDISALPVSVRLGHVLQAMDARCLGDLHGKSHRELLAYKNCGRTTVTELHALIARAATGEFADDMEEGASVGELLRALEDAITCLPPRDRALVLARLGDGGRRPQTLEELGQPLGVTRERIRQILEKSFARLRKARGPRIPRLLDALDARCGAEPRPLTPALLDVWLRQEGSMPRRSAEFHVRLLAALDDRLPCWPEGRSGVGGFSAETARLGADLGAILRGTGGQLPLDEAFRRLREQRPWKRLESGLFLRLLRPVRSVAVEFAEPERPTVRLRRMTAPFLAMAALEGSDCALTIEEVHEKAVAIFGRALVDCGPRSIGNILAHSPEIFLLGPGRYGLRKHFTLPEREWPRVRTDFIRLLREENRPISAYEVIDEQRIAGLGEITAHEFASIVRDDRRLTDLGRLLFALEKWGIEERPLIRDLIAKILREADELLTSEQIGERVRDLRSVSANTTATVLQKCPGVRDFGFGYFGLTEWGEKKVLALLARPAVIERVVKRSTPPLPEAIAA